MHLWPCFTTNDEQVSELFGLHSTEESDRNNHDLETFSRHTLFWEIAGESCGFLWLYRSIVSLFMLLCFSLPVYFSCISSATIWSFRLVCNCIVVLLVCVCLGWWWAPRCRSTAPLSSLNLWARDTVACGQAGSFLICPSTPSESFKRKLSSKQVFHSYGIKNRWLYVVCFCTKVYERSVRRFDLIDWLIDLIGYTEQWLWLQFYCIISQVHKKQVKRNGPEFLCCIDGIIRKQKILKAVTVA